MIPELALLLLAAGTPATAPALSDAWVPADVAAETPSTDEQALYTRATAALDRREWDAAERTFAEVAALKGDRADAALYWRAYALNKGGRKDEALRSLAALEAGYPRSRWTSDAKALDLEIRQAAGQQPAVPAGTSDDLKLMALGGLMNADPDRALPLIKQMLAGPSSPHVRDRALFVLAQSGVPAARQLLQQVARDNANGDLQAKAVHYLGLFGGEESRQSLLDIYTSSPNLEARKAVLTALMIGGDKTRLAEVARKETNPELRREAINQLGVSGARAELAKLYQEDRNAEIRLAVVNALFVAGATDQMTELATKETDPAVRIEAVQRLGLMGSGTAPTLKAIYTNDQSPEVKRAVLHAYFVQGNAAALVDIARTERDASMKKEAVQMLSLMNSKEAVNFMLELLK